VISAAHCCTGQTPSDLRVVVGEHNLFEDEGPEMVRVQSKNASEKFWVSSTKLIFGPGLISCFYFQDLYSFKADCPSQL
jgi:glutamine amidotransferase-like uncharacterized protein